uniref:DeoR/GlpR family DNA-binding transcription regulator n=1 Tax=Streptococcus pluranimalium TaxID=82348 RepID=UPI003F68E351
MIKKERLLKILEEVNKKGVININDIVAKLEVSDMTIRRDLAELEKEGKLLRIHGGAQSIESGIPTERSNTEKQSLQTVEKEEIACLAASLVHEGETLFIGPGTTLEAFARKLTKRRIRVITNSLPIFDILKDSKSIDLILLGGEYRPITGAFVGSLTNKSLGNLSFSKAFVSANGIHNNNISTYSENEGLVQQIALEKAMKKYLLLDNSKFNKFDFYDFYTLDNIDYLLTDTQTTPKQMEPFKTLTSILSSENLK